MADATRTSKTTIDGSGTSVNALLDEIERLRVIARERDRYRETLNLIACGSTPARGLARMALAPQKVERNADEKSAVCGNNGCQLPKLHKGHCAPSLAAMLA